MTTNKEEKAVKWEKQRVQRVLKYHNNQYGTNIMIKGKAEDIYPELKGQPNWDWVGHDTKSGEEIAIEVKKLTDFRLEERGSIIWGILEDIKDDLSNKLPGTFYIYIDIPKDYRLALNQKNKNILVETLQNAILVTAQRMGVGEKVDLRAKIEDELTSKLPNRFMCTLIKISEEDSKIGLGSGVTGFWSRELNKRELKQFRQLISHANNEQLRVAKEEFNVKEIFLVFICEGLRLANRYTLADAIKRINCDSYSRINHIYYVSGEKVVEIPLPTP